jgi:glycerol-3-phosphate dehydrogenase (NAD(P)+)
MGAGMWGTTFAQVLCDAGTPAMLWARSPELAETINTRHENPGYLPGVGLTPALTASADPAQVLDGAGLVVLAVPAQSLRSNLSGWTQLVPPSVPLVSLIKGIELGTCERMSQVIAEVTGAGAERIAVISGPNLAREIAQRQHAATVVACTDDTVAKRLQQACHTPYFRPYTNPDAVGMGLGDNTRATLITRGLAEISRLGAALGADQHTFAGLAGLGDLVATCNSPQSRNRTFGEKLGGGQDAADVAAGSRQVAEGTKSAEPVLTLAHASGVEMPITQVVAGVMHGTIAVGQAAVLLTSRSAKPERYGV